MVGHKRESCGTGKSNPERELLCKKIEHDDGERTKNEGDDSNIPLGLRERKEQMSQNIKQRGVEIGGSLLVKFELTFEIIPRVLIGVDFIEPERFLVKGIEPQRETDQQAGNDDKNLFLAYPIHEG